jgi:mycofactocin glycosyltransferase
MADRFVIDAAARRLAGGQIVAGGTPFRLFRLTPGGRRILDLIEAGATLPARHHALTDRLVAANVLHPIVEPTAATDRVTIVMPTLGQPGVLPTGAPLIVVDDASPRLVTVDAMLGADRAAPTVIRLERNVGPGQARMAGLAAVETEFVAFVDADVTVPDGWLTGLLGHFDDPRVALVAPRVTSSGELDGSVLRRYEQWRSPLDLGPLPALITPGGRVGYVPSAAIVVRTAALAAIGGFDAGLRFGEDVDLVWRLIDAGWSCRYEPAVQVLHAPRTTWRRWWSQRVGYGSSAAPLSLRHPGKLAPVRMSAWSGAAWAAVALGAPVAGAALTAGATLTLAQRLDDLDDPLIESTRLAALGTLFAGRQLASAVVRAWWPIALAAAVRSARARRLIVASAIIPGLLDWRDQRPPLDPLRSIGLRVADDVAYGCGVWRGVLRQLHVGPLIPAFTWRDRWTRRTATAPPRSPQRSS